MLARFSIICSYPDLPAGQVQQCRYRYLDLWHRLVARHRLMQHHQHGIVPTVCARTGGILEEAYSVSKSLNLLQRQLKTTSIEFLAGF